MIWSFMKRTHKNRIGYLRISVLFLAVSLATAPLALAQSAARFLGSITAIAGNTLTVKTDAGEQRQVEIPASATLKRIAPGQKDLNAAAAMNFSELAVGDRVLVKLDPDSTGATPQAAQIIAVKQEDLAKKQQNEREDWQRRGVGGLVKSVDAAAGAITVTTGTGPTAKSVVVHTTKASVLKRYAPGSVRFDQAQPGSIDAIHAGDQLRARGDKNADGTEMTAGEVVSGTFRNIAGTISAIDAGASTLAVKDLATKKLLTIHITADAQLRRIPDRMAQMLAMRLKSGSAPAAEAQGAGPRTGGGDPQQFLSRAPTIQLGDLQKGEAVMVVSTDGATDVNAIMVLAGVEPLLEAPAATNLLSNWSMGGGGAEAAAGAQ